jgi:hypothetical protein
MPISAKPASTAKSGKPAPLVEPIEKDNPALRDALPKVYARGCHSEYLVKGPRIVNRAMALSVESLEKIRDTLLPRLINGEISLINGRNI